MAKKKATKKAETKKAPAKKKAKKKKAAAVDAEGKPVKKKRKSRKKKAEEARVKVFWGVFNHAMKRVALYEFNQRKAAEKRAQELSPEGKPPHFVQKVKQEVTEEVTVDDAEAPKKKATKKKKAKS
jgi:hypothetical protein